MPIKLVYYGSFNMPKVARLFLLAVINADLFSVTSLTTCPPRCIYKQHWRRVVKSSSQLCSEVLSDKSDRLDNFFGAVKGRLFPPAAPTVVPRLSWSTEEPRTTENSFASESRRNSGNFYSLIPPMINVPRSDMYYVTVTAIISLLL